MQSWCHHDIVSLFPCNAGVTFCRFEGIQSVIHGGHGEGGHCSKGMRWLLVMEGNQEVERDWPELGPAHNRGLC